MATTVPERSNREPADAALLPLVTLLLGVPFLLPLSRALFGIPIPVRLVVGAVSWAVFLWSLRGESAERRRGFLCVFVPLVVLALAPVNTSLTWGHIAVLLAVFTAVVFGPPLFLKRPDVITFRLFPDRIDWMDVFYTVLSIPLAWGAFQLYFGFFSPEVPGNWPLPASPDTAEILKLFGGINGVGIWDELFFINVCYAVFRMLFPARIAIPAQSVIYVSVLYDMAFTGWGPVFVGFLALTQGIMYERSKVLIWVLLVHLIVDYFLFQAIIGFHYPGLNVWWH